MSTGNRRGKRKAKPPQVVLGIKAITADDTGLVKEVPAAGPTVAKTHRRFRQQDRKEEVHAMCFAPGEKQVLLGLANNAVETLNLEDGEKYVVLRLCVDLAAMFAHSRHPVLQAVDFLLVGRRPLRHWSCSCFSKCTCV
jgi:hypothetical protein